MAVSLIDKAKEIVSLFKNSLGQDVPISDRSFLYQFALAIAGLSVSTDKKALYAVRENLAISASEAGLTEIGRNVLGRDPFQAVAAEISFDIGVTDGTVIAPGTEFVAEENGLTYGTQVTSIGDVSGTLTVSATCTLQGAETNVSIGSVVNISSPISGVDASGTVVSVPTTGVDSEGIEEYRTKILDAERSQGGGGNAWDYRIWGEEVPGVKRIYPYGGEFVEGANVGGPSSRTVFVQATESIDSDGIAPQSLLDEVRSYIITDPLNGRNRIPMGVPDSTFFVESIRRISFKVSVYGSEITWPDDAITDLNQALSDYFFFLQPAVEGVDVISGKTNVITETSISNIVYDTLINYGIQATKVSFSLDTGDGTGLIEYTLPAGGLAKLDSILYPGV